MTKPKILPSYDYLHKRLFYNPEDGSFIWKPTEYSQWNGRYADTKAGYIRGEYYGICIDYVRFQLHRIAWKMFYNSEPAEMLDHINSNKLDNRIINLREATNTQNQMNNKPRENTSSRFKGVDFMKSKNKWRATITINKKRKHLGLFLTEKEASNAYTIAAQERFGEFARIV